MLTQQSIEICPPPQVPLFLLVQSQSPKDIVGSDISNWKLYASIAITELKGGLIKRKNKSHHLWPFFGKILVDSDLPTVFFLGFPWMAGCPLQLFLLPLLVLEIRCVLTFPGYHGYQNIIGDKHQSSLLLGRHSLGSNCDHYRQLCSHVDLYVA